MGQWNSDELSLLKGKGDGSVQVRGLSVLINAAAILSGSTSRREPGGPAVIQMESTSFVPQMTGVITSDHFWDLVPLL